MPAKKRTPGRLRVNDVYAPPAARIHAPMPALADAPVMAVSLGLIVCSVGLVVMVVILPAIYAAWLSVDTGVDSKSILDQLPSDRNFLQMAVVFRYVVSFAGGFLCGRHAGNRAIACTIAMVVLATTSALALSINEPVLKSFLADPGITVRAAVAMILGAWFATRVYRARRVQAANSAATR